MKHAQPLGRNIGLCARQYGSIDRNRRNRAPYAFSTVDAARQAIVASIRTNSTGATEGQPGCRSHRRRIGRLFIEKPGATLTLKLTPRGTVPAMPLIQQVKLDPLGALAQFQVEASTRQ